MADKIQVDISVNNTQAIQGMSAFTNATKKTDAQLDKLNEQMGTLAAKNLAKTELAASVAGKSVGGLARDFTLLERAGSGSLRGLVGSFGLVTTAAAAAGVAVGSLVLVAKEAVELGKLGAQAITAKSSFDLMFTSIGASTNEMNEMRAAAQGTINDLKLFELASYSIIGVEGEVGRAIGAANDQLITIARAAYKARPSLESVEFAYTSLIDGIKRVEKRLVDNLGLQVKAREANERYAESVGKSTDELTSQEVQLAFLNEVLRAGGVLVNQVGGDVSTMQDAFARASAASENLRIALGEKLAPTVVEATNAWTNFLLVLSSGLSDEPASELAVLQNTLALQKQALADIQSQLQESGGIDTIEKTVIAARNAWMELVGAEEMAQNAITKTTEAIAALQAPLLQETILTANAARVAREYAADTSLLDARLGALAVTLLASTQSATAFAAAQNKIFTAASETYDKSLQSTIRSLSAMGVSFGEATAEGRAYAGQLRQLEILHAQGIITDEQYAFSLGRIDSRMSTLIDTVKEAAREAERLNSILSRAWDVYYDSLGSTIRSLSALGATYDDATTTAKKFADQEYQLFIAHERGEISTRKYYYELGQLDLEMSDVRDTYKETTPEVEKLTNAFADLVSGLAESTLAPSFSIEGLEPTLSVREDEVDEHYRRLAAIAVRGQEEIDKHQEDWADTLELIPADKRAQGIEAIQAWAKDTVQAYDKGLDFSLINRDAIKKRIIEALLAQEMKEQLVDEITAELGGAVSEAQVAAAASAALGGTPLSKISLGGITFGTAKDAPDMSTAADQINTALNDAFRDRVDVSGMLRTTALAFTTGSKAFERELRASGGVTGGVILNGITDAVVDGAPEITRRLAYAIAPEVAAIIARNKRAEGAP